MIVIGGGDTGADCIGTSLRHGCMDVVNTRLLDQPPAERADNNPWPQWPRIYRLDYSHEENKAKNGNDPRAYPHPREGFVDDGNSATSSAIKTVEVDWSKPVEGGAPFSEVEGSENGQLTSYCSPLKLLSAPNWRSAKCLGLEDPKPRPRQLADVHRRARPSSPPTWKAYSSPATVAAASRSSSGPSMSRGAVSTIDRYLMGSSLLPAPGVTMGSALAGA